MGYHPRARANQPRRTIIPSCVILRHGQAPCDNRSSSSSSSSNATLPKDKLKPRGYPPKAIPVVFNSTSSSNTNNLPLFVRGGAGAMRKRANVVEARCACLNILLQGEHGGEGTGVAFTFGIVIPLEPQSRFGDRPVKFQVFCPQNGTAVL